MNQADEKLLRYTIIANGIFSALSGLALILFEGLITDLFGIEYTFAMTGVSPLVFAAFVFFTVLRNQIKRKLVWAIIWMDVAWVVGSIIVVILPLSISTVGIWMIAIVALFVADFAFFQYKGLRKATTV